jgi:hypothetical protein
MRGMDSSRGEERSKHTKEGVLNTFTALAESYKLRPFSNELNNFIVNYALAVAAAGLKRPKPETFEKASAIINVFLFKLAEEAATLSDRDAIKKRIDDAANSHLAQYSTPRSRRQQKALGLEPGRVHSGRKGDSVFRQQNLEEGNIGRGHENVDPPSDL